MEDTSLIKVEAFQSVHCMIHAAIASHGTRATLRQVYEACQLRGRILYKRSGGSRLITHNEHWKSQIRHALYTSGRFCRVPDSPDLFPDIPEFFSEKQQKNHGAAALCVFSKIHSIK